MLCVHCVCVSVWVLIYVCKCVWTPFTYNVTHEKQTCRKPTITTGWAHEVLWLKCNFLQKFLLNLIWTKKKHVGSVELILPFQHTALYQCSRTIGLWLVAAGSAPRLLITLATTLFNFSVAERCDRVTLNRHGPSTEAAKQTSVVSLCMPVLLLLWLVKMSPMQIA